MAFSTDESLWYNNGKWGQLGYAVPNFAGHTMSLNAGIRRLVAVTGLNLSGAMHNNPDVSLRSPPTITTVTKVHKLILRARQMIGARGVAEAETSVLNPVHATPAPAPFMIYPVPYFQVRNPFLQEWCGLALTALAEAMQHTDNLRSFDFTVSFGGTIGQYLQRIYRLMATELLGIDPAKAKDPAFVLTEQDLAAYNPSKFFTSTESIDTMPPIQDVPAEDDLRVLTSGIPANMLVNLAHWPTGEPVVFTAPNGGQAAQPAAAGTAQQAAAATSGQAAAAPPAFPAPPAP